MKRVWTIEFSDSCDEEFQRLLIDATKEATRRYEQQKGHPIPNPTEVELKAVSDVQER